jgi:hypothetical protein
MELKTVAFLVTFFLDCLTLKVTVSIDWLAWHNNPEDLNLEQ